jgi:mitotic spindle assembly checkpoint protein MAD1
MRFKKHTEARYIVLIMGKLTHLPRLLSSLALGEHEATQKDGEKIEELEQTLFELRGEIGAGRHVPPSMQVLSSSANPAQDWADLRQAALDRLKEENAALLQRLFALEASGTHNAPPATDSVADRSSTTTGLVPRASWAAVCRGKAQLEDELRQKEKRMLRLRQAFAAKTAEFRETLLAILAIKVAFYDNEQVRVMSEYDLGAAFVFQPVPWDAAKDGGGGGDSSGAARMQLVAQGEGRPQKLPQLMRDWVGLEQSIPCFLVSVTLSATISGSASASWGAREGTVGGPACIYCAAHNTQYTFLH